MFSREILYINLYLSLLLGRGHTQFIINISIYLISSWKKGPQKSHSKFKKSPSDSGVLSKNLSPTSFGCFRKDPKNPRTPYTPAKLTAGTPFSHEGLVQMIFPDFMVQVIFRFHVNFPGCKWLITMVIVSPSSRVASPFQMAFPWLINGDDPN